MREQVRVTIEIYGGQTMIATGPADELREVVARRLRALGLAEGPSIIVQDAVMFYPRATAALYRQGENHTTAEPVGRVTAMRTATSGQLPAASGELPATSNGAGDGDGCTGETARATNEQQQTEG